MFGAPREDPPSNWAGATHAGEDTYYRISSHPNGEGVAGEDVIVWHWCGRTTRPHPGDDVPRWSGAMCALHRVLSVDPLTLDPSLACADCSNHGYLREGVWQPV